MSAPRIDFALDQGSSFSKSLSILNSSGQPVSFTGATAEMQLRTSLEASEPALTLSTSNSRITLASGLISLALSSSSTAALAAGKYVYDLEVTSSGNTTKYASGVITVNREVTR